MIIVKLDKLRSLGIQVFDTEDLPVNLVLLIQNHDLLAARFYVSLDIFYHIKTEIGISTYFST